MRSCPGAVLISPAELTQLNRLHKALHNGLMAAIQALFDIPPVSYRMGALQMRLGFSEQDAPVLLGIVGHRPARTIALPGLQVAPHYDEAEPLPGPPQMPFFLEEVRGDAPLVLVTETPHDESVQAFVAQCGGTVQADYANLAPDFLAVLDLPVERLQAMGPPPCSHLNDLRSALHLGRPEVFDAFAGRKLERWLSAKDAALLETACRTAAAGALEAVLVSFDDALFGPAMFETGSGERLVPMLSA